MRKSQIKITRIVYASGAVTHKVSGTVNGEFRRENHQNAGDALTVKQNWEREIMNLPNLPTVTSRLTLAQVSEAEACYHRLAGSQVVTLSQAVDFALRNFRPAMKEIRVINAFDKFIEQKRAQNVRPATLIKLRVKLSRLCSLHGAALVHELQAEQLRPLIFRAGCGPQTQHTTYRCLTNFFNWAKLNEFCAVSPMEKIAGITLDRGEPEILSVSEARKLLVSAAQFKDGLLTPYLALGLFCAIRPTELARLSWDDIDLDAQTVTIGAKIAKMRGRRIVEIPPNAIAFLLPFALAKRPLVGPNWTRDFNRVKAIAGFAEGEGMKPWTQDILRHTGISYHLAKHKAEGATASWAGNSPDMIHKHYKGLVKAKDVEAFYSLTPDTLAASIVPMVQAA